MKPSPTSPLLCLPLASLLLAGLLSACSTANPAATAKTAAKAVPQVWIPLSCSAELQWDTCLKEAEALCPQGYDVADKKEDLSTQSRSMQVSCRGSR